MTVVTHGFAGNVTDWVIPMCNKMAQYRSSSGTNSSLYQVTVSRNAQGGYVFSQQFLDGVNPAESDSGQIFVALDWSSLAGGSPSTTVVAAPAVAALLANDLIPELNGHALAELPLHLVGHSRGGSLITEMARLLGAQGLWVDQITTLDPHPVSYFADAPMVNYANVLFADNYWQNLGDNLFVPNGEFIPGAYNRQLSSLGGGYSSPHSDVHLWYHGTIDWKTPISVDAALLTAAERAAWWTTIEAAGTNAGYLYTGVAGGDRLSVLEPAGSGKGRVRDGFNQKWDLGAGVAANRTSLPANSGAWPNLIRFDVAGTTQIPAGSPIQLAFYWQAGAASSGTVTMDVFLDSDSNPYNQNALQIGTLPLALTGTTSVSSGTAQAFANPALPGTYRVCATVKNGSKSRTIYAAQWIRLEGSPDPVVLLSPRIENDSFRFLLSGNPGQTIVVQASINLQDWAPIATNTLAAKTLEVTNPATAAWPARYFRAVGSP